MNPIYARRSIRKYNDGPEIPKRVLESIVKAGMNAPSAVNQQPWQFVIVTDRPVMTGITKIHRWSQMLHEAKAAIVVCGNAETQLPQYWVQDCAAATQNILLEIVNQGLGGCWCGVYPEPNAVEGIQQLLNTPKGIVPFAVVAIGYPGEDKPANDKYDNQKVCYNGWEKPSKTPKMA